MKNIPISEASHAQLYDYCTVNLGLDIPKVGTSKAVMIAKIEAAAPGTTEIPVRDDPTSPAQDEARQATIAAAAQLAEEAPKQRAAEEERRNALNPRQAAQHHHDPKIEVFIPASPEPGGDRAVPVAVGGVQFLIKRDEWVSVPYRVFEVLKNAVQTTFTPIQDDIGRLSVEQRDTYSYPFSTRNEPSAEEIAAWHGRTKNVELA